MLKLLGRITSGNVQKVAWLLEELGVAYTREDFGRQFGNTETDEYRALNPNAKVPTLVDGDTVIWESNTILRYLASQQASPLYPSDLAARSQVERWMDWQLNALNPFYMAVFKETRKPEAERSASLAEDAKGMSEQLALLEGQLAGQDYLAGGDLTLADICLGPIVNRCLSFPVERPAFPKLEAWRDRIAARPAFAKGVPG